MITPRGAKRWMVVLYTFACYFSYFAGGFRSCISLVLLGAWYNNLNGSNVSWIIRNLINALGYLSFALGALEVVLGCPLPLQAGQQLTWWFLLVGMVIFSTVQMHDIQDLQGDLKRGRKTMPVALGDSATRRISACLIVFWSLLIPKQWNMGSAGQIGTLTLGIVLANRVLLGGATRYDKATFRIWNVWIVWLYASPLLFT